MANPGRANAIPQCAACKYFKKRCLPECIFAPYFPRSEPEKFQVVHKVFSASNVSKMLMEVDVPQRAEAANSLYLDARRRLEDPVHGSLGIITQLSRMIQETQAEVATVRAALAGAKASASPSQAHLGRQLQQTDCSNSYNSSLAEEHDDSNTVDPVGYYLSPEFTAADRMI